MIRKQTNHLTLILLCFTILVLASLGCSLAGLLGESTSSKGDPTPTRTPLPTFTPASAEAWIGDISVEGTQPEEQVQEQQASEEVTQAEQPTETQAAEVAQEPTPEPVVEPSATPEPVPPSVTILQNMNVRQGPGIYYPIIGPGPAGQTSLILGRNSDSSWLQVEYPSADGKGWVYADLVQINNSIEGVAIASAPPPPPTPTPIPSPTPGPPVPTAVKYQFTPTGWHASGNPGIIHFKGRIRDEAGNLVNGYSIIIDNWAWSIMSHPTGASNHYPEKGDGEWDVVFPTQNLSDGVGSWYLSVVRYTCPDFLSRFDAQCKQFDRLSEEVYIEVNWPDETVINADWICHWDCNKGLYVDGFHR